ncbi:MAG: ABC transporter ATP-binding protein [Saprospiraceae bacterium]|nr:ABC transporter ATP-binding protein [Saprospiraceae bacterium]
MVITLSEIGKRFRYEWIFKNINQTFEAGETYALLGPNGSGKSTLMKVLSGHLSPSNGTISFSHEGQKLDIDAVYLHISYAAPYIDLIEEMTLSEIIGFHARFKPLSFSEDKPLTINDLVGILGFEKSIDKPIRFFSSGMKQRLKLALAVCTQTPIVLLDEPTTNLDAQGVDWYKKLVERFILDQNRLLIVASNIEHDYDFCKKRLSILDFKV